MDKSEAKFFITTFPKVKSNPEKGKKENMSTTTERLNQSQLQLEKKYS